MRLITRYTTLYRQPWSICVVLVFMHILKIISVDIYVFLFFDWLFQLILFIWIFLFIILIQILCASFILWRLKTLRRRSWKRLTFARSLGQAFVVSLKSIINLIWNAYLLCCVNLKLFWSRWVETQLRSLTVICSLYYF